MTTEKMPLVSMIMATNRPASPLMRECLDSMASQTYPAMEIIVVDDGSPADGRLADLLSHYDVKHVRQPPIGVSVAFNRGVFHAQGELIGFFGDDDRYPADWVSQHVERHLRPPDVILTYGRARSIDGSGAVFSEQHLDDVDQAGLYSRRTSVFGGGFLVRREDFAAAGGFNSLVRLAQDLDLVLRLSHLGAFAYIPDAYFDYRTHGSNNTRRYRALAGSIRAINRSHRDFLATRDRHDLDAAINSSQRRNDRYAAWRVVRSMRSHLGMGEWSDAAGDLVWGARFAPLAPLDAVVRRMRPRK